MKSLTILKGHHYGVALASIPVIGIAARDLRVDQEGALALGAEAFFQKPVDHDQLVAAIRQSLGV